MGNEAWDEHEVKRPITNHLVGNVDVPAAFQDPWHILACQRARLLGWAREGGPSVARRPGGLAGNAGVVLGLMRLPGRWHYGSTRKDSRIGCRRWHSLQVK